MERKENTLPGKVRQWWEEWWEIAIPALVTVSMALGVMFVLFFVNSCPISQELMTQADKIAVTTQDEILNDPKYKNHFVNGGYLEIKVVNPEKQGDYKVITAHCQRGQITADEIASMWKPSYRDGYTQYAGCSCYGSIPPKTAFGPGARNMIAEDRSGDFKFCYYDIVAH